MSARDRLIEAAKDTFGPEGGLDAFLARPDDLLAVMVEAHAERYLTDPAFHAEVEKVRAQAEWAADFYRRTEEGKGT